MSYRDCYYNLLILSDQFLHLYCLYQHTGPCHVLQTSFNIKWNNILWYPVNEAYNILCPRQSSSKRCSEHNIKLHLMMRLQFCRSGENEVTSSLPLLLGLLWPRLVVPVRVPSKEIPTQKIKIWTYNEHNSLTHFNFFSSSIQYPFIAITPKSTLTC